MAESPHTVSDVMTPAAVAVGRRASYKEMAELMREWNVSAMPVLEGDGRVIGVVSEADLLLKEQYRLVEPQRPPEFADELAKASACYAEDLMSSPVIAVHADATIAEAARIMARRHIKWLPVTDGAGLLLGVVSRGDLLKVFLRTDEDISEEIRRTVLPSLPRDTRIRVSVTEGVVVLSGQISDRSLVTLVTRAVRAVEGVVDTRLDLTGRQADMEGTGHTS